MSAATITHLGLHHLALRVRDLARSKAFYCEHFGMRVVWEPDADNVYLSSGSDNLALHAAPALAPGGAEQPLDHLGFIVATPAAVYAAAAALQARGVPIARAARAHRDGSHSLYVSDPDGNLVQVLYEPTLSSRGRDDT